MAKNIQKKIRDLSYEYNMLLDRFEAMEKKAPYNGWRHRDGYMDNVLIYLLLSTPLPPWYGGLITKIKIKNI